MELVTRKSFVRHPVARNWHTETFHIHKWQVARWVSARILALPHKTAQIDLDPFRHLTLDRSPLKPEAAEAFTRDLQARVDQVIAPRLPTAPIDFRFVVNPEGKNDHTFAFINEFAWHVDSIMADRGMVFSQMRRHFFDIRLQIEGHQIVIELPQIYLSLKKHLAWLVVHERLHQLFATVLRRGGEQSDRSLAAFNLLNEGCVCVMAYYVARALKLHDVHQISFQDEVGTLGIALEFLLRNIEAEGTSFRYAVPELPRVQSRYWSTDLATSNVPFAGRGRQSLPARVPIIPRAWILLRLFQDEFQVSDEMLAERIFRHQEFPNLSQLFPLCRIPSSTRAMRDFVPIFMKMG